MEYPKETSGVTVYVSSINLMGEKTKTQFQFLLKPGIKYLSLMFQKVNYLNVFLMISVKKYNLLLFKSLKYEFE